MLNKIFLERRPMDEFLRDNSTVFYSEVLKEMLNMWNMHHFSRVAY